jgi:hypothetical protein
MKVVAELKMLLCIHSTSFSLDQFQFHRLIAAFTANIKALSFNVE